MGTAGFADTLKQNVYDKLTDQHNFCGGPWLAANRNFMQITHQIQVLTDLLSPAILLLNKK